MDSAHYIGRVGRLAVALGVGAAVATGHGVAGAEPNSPTTPVLMPPLGDSTTEGTVTRWLKKVGDTVEVDEPLLEVSTDKVDVEIPSPAAGTLISITAQPDEVVTAGEELARISAESGSDALVEVPAGLSYTTDHLWLRRIDAETVRIGITDFAQSSLGELVFVQLPAAGTPLVSGEAFGEVESAKVMSDLMAPVTASVAAVNSELTADPQVVNADPYGAGWLLELQAPSGALDDQISGLMTADGYRGLLGV